ncbi:MAG: HAMP domain-containing protein [Oceanospirillaceae bacterium]|nr:HAMP domain-containing protein [Oceanospirillaceae bacterium]
MHQQFHDEFHRYLSTYHYYDIFLIDVQTGNIVYTVFKELDFATNLESGAYSNTNLAEVFQTARDKLKEGETAFIDYKLYIPSYNAPAGFIASPVVENGKKIGVLVVQVPISELNAITHNRSGLGESGESYLVGQDGLVRTDSEHTNVVEAFRHPAEHKSNSVVIEKSVAGESGFTQIEDFDGTQVYIAYAPVKVFDYQWGLIAEIEVNEALRHVVELRNIMLGVMAVALLVIAAMAFGIGQYLSRPIVRLAEGLRDIAKSGNFAERLPVHSKDEVGKVGYEMNGLLENLNKCFAETNHVLKGVSEKDLSRRVGSNYRGDLHQLSLGMNDTISRLQHMQAEQQKQDAALRESAAHSEKLMQEAQQEAIKNKRIKQALDACSTNVMIADENHDIVYVNEVLTEMMQAAQSDIRQQLGQFDASKLIGNNIDIFHKNPAHQRGMLAALRDTYRTQISIGERKFTLVANPINDEAGQRIGTVVEWNDVTAQLKREVEEKRIADENARIRQALDACSTNVMIGDAENNIIYMNSSVAEMMRNVESDLRKVLPRFDANNIIGQKIDIYHKNPAHQQNMLAKLNSTYKTQIEVGERTFALTANPIFSADKQRIGTVVEWLDRTQEIRAENEVNGMIKAAGRGDYTQRMKTDDKVGFVKNLAEGLNTLVETTEVAVNEVVGVLGSLAQGNLSRKIEGEYMGVFARLKNDANATVDKLTEVVNNIMGSAETVRSGADEIAQGNGNLSQRTEEQASSLEETSSSMQHMASNVKQSENNAKQAAQLASEAQRKAQQGGEVVARAVTAMGQINAASKKIADIIGVIDEIAFQTNLLALNAAVEAARAGEQGKGFAVVAGEVRNLAQRSAGAAKEIKELIQSSVEKVEDGTELVNESGETLTQIVAAVNQVDVMIQKIAQMAAEQTSGINQVSLAVAQMHDVTEQNAALVEEVAASSESMADHARKMQEMLSFFK